jgi:signal transduction histidine kinase
VQELLRRISALARAPADRQTEARQLARILGGEDVIVLLHDSDVGVFLPAPGFRQTLCDARRWRQLTAECVARGEAFGERMRVSSDDPPRPVYAIGCPDGLILVIIGATGRPPAADELAPMLPLLACVLQGERGVAHATARERVAKESAVYAERLVAAFNQSRVELEAALAAAEESRRIVAEANAQLQDQAMEMEVQAEELASQTEQLHTTNVELEKARDEAAAASKAKSEFLATMSHELRTPLNAIAGHVQLIELGIYGAVTDDQRVALERIDRNQRHLLGLINDILNLARIEAGRVEYHITAVGVMELLSDIAAMIEPQIHARSLEYHVVIPAAKIAVRADREKLEQILLNLLSNAVKFTPAGGSIEVWCATRQDRPDVAFIRVTDTGIGIAEDKLASIFEPFVQVDAGHTRPADGTGLGLAISRDLAIGMGGELRARSIVGEGSSFTLSLPTAPGDPDDQRAGSTAVRSRAE